METINLAASSDLRSFEWLAVGSTESTLLRQADPRIPLSIPASQRYFWTTRWQVGEEESRHDIANGEVEQFDDPLDAIRWLLSEEE